MKTCIASGYFSCSGKVLVSIVLLRFAWKNLEKILELFLIILVGVSSILAAFEASRASISLQISTIVTTFMEIQSEESLASLFLRTLAWWGTFSIAFRTGSSHKSDNMGRSILIVPRIFSK